MQKSIYDEMMLKAKSVMNKMKKIRTKRWGTLAQKKKKKKRTLVHTHKVCVIPKDKKDHSRAICFFGVT